VIRPHLKHINLQPRLENLTDRKAHNDYVVAVHFPGNFRQLAFLILSAHLLLVCGCGPDPSVAGQATKSRGDGIVAALERYKSDTGRYPLTLYLLSPNYLGKIESPAGGQWRYVPTDENRDYTLSFSGASRNWSGTYSSATKSWQIDKKGS
jgi:hypothetical protein